MSATDTQSTGQSTGQSADINQTAEQRAAIGQTASPANDSSGAQPIMGFQKEIVNHDYRSDWSDRMLGLGKKLLPFPEWRHEMLGKVARNASWIPGMGFHDRHNLHTIISFPDRSNSLYLGAPVILPAGACKFGENIADFAKMGFGGVTVGTATHEAREGNLFRPRVAMITADRGINNSMGLNNPGINVLSRAVDSSLGQAHRYKLSVGLSVGETPEISDAAERLEDLLLCFRHAYNVADYVEINVSCPNTGTERVDKDTGFIRELFHRIMEMRKALPVRKAVYAKLSPDMNEKHLLTTLDVLEKSGVNGLVLFNTFPSERARYLKMQTLPENLISVREDGAKGGISGRILYPNTLRAVSYIKAKYPRFSILASGGVDHGAKMLDLMLAGADAVQSYSVVAYRWNAVHKMRMEFERALKEAGFRSVEELLEKRKSAIASA